MHESMDMLFVANTQCTTGYLKGALVYITEHFREAGIVVVFLPPYSPDLSPILEELFSYYLKRHDELLQAVDDPIPIIQAAFDDVSPDQCKAWITHSGYNL